MNPIVVSSLILKAAVTLASSDAHVLVLRAQPQCRTKGVSMYVLLVPSTPATNAKARLLLPLPQHWLPRLAECDPSPTAISTLPPFSQLTRLPGAY
jgi:hypothetical protein